VMGGHDCILAKGVIVEGSLGEMVFYMRPQAKGYDAQQTREGRLRIALQPPPVDNYRAEIEEFSQAILEGREFRLGGSEGLRSRKIVEGCYESAIKSGTVVIRS